MANANTEITLDQLHDSILNAIRSKFPNLQTVEAYRPDRKSIPLPACFLELEEFETADDAPDPGTEQLAVMARFSARFLISFKSSQPKLTIRKLAAAFAAFARFKRWGLPVGPAEVIGAYPDDFDIELDQFECWRVEWRQVIHLGEGIWNDQAFTGEPVFSWSPHIGIGNERYYRPLPELLPPDAELPPEDA